MWRFNKFTPSKFFKSNKHSGSKDIFKPPIRFKIDLKDIQNGLCMSLLIPLDSSNLGLLKLIICRTIRTPSSSLTNGSLSKKTRARLSTPSQLPLNPKQRSSTTYSPIMPANNWPTPISGFPFTPAHPSHHSRVASVSRWLYRSCFQLCWRISCSMVRYHRRLRRTQILFVDSPLHGHR